MHLGSLYTALASFLDAKAHHGSWILRIDDLDAPRNVSGAAENIIETLQVYGLNWHGPIHYQSQNLDVYKTIISKLTQQALVYPCTCTRKALSEFPIYPGICRKTKKNNNNPHSLRIKSDDTAITFDDELQGSLNHSIASQHGDFIIKRKDDITAYQLAVVIDDYQQKISHVIRGYDLLDSTPKQIYLQTLLGYPTPNYCHIPVITDQKGNKLSKQTFAEGVSTTKPQKTLYLLLELLKQNPPPHLKKASVQNILNWAAEHWNSQPLKKIRAIKY